MATLDLGKLDLSDDENEDLRASPTRVTTKPPPDSRSANVGNATSSTSLPSQSRYDAEHAREEALRRELEGVRSINEVIEGVVSSLERAKGNMDVSIACNQPCN